MPIILVNSALPSDKNSTLPLPPDLSSQAAIHLRVSGDTITVVPGAAAGREPVIHNPCAAEYGFRARRFAASRNDGKGVRQCFAF